MMKPTVGRKKTGDKPIPKGRVKHISIDFHDNGGNTVRSDHEMSKPKGKAPKGMMGMGMLGPSTESHEAGFGDNAGMMDHMNALTGGAPSGPPAPETPPAPAGGAPAPGADDEEAPEGE